MRSFKASDFNMVVCGANITVLLNSVYRGNLLLAAIILCLVVINLYAGLYEKKE